MLKTATVVCVILGLPVCLLAAPLTVRVSPTDGKFRGSTNVNIQAAIDHVAKNGGGTVEVGPGRYLLRDAIQLRSHVRLVGSTGKTIFKLAAGPTSALSQDLDAGSTTVCLSDPSGFQTGDGVFLQDTSGHGFQVTTATLGRKLDGNRFELLQSAQQEYRTDRKAQLKFGFSGIGGWSIRDAAVIGISVEGNWREIGSVYLGGCRGGGIYLFACENVAIQNCTVRQFHGDAISFQGTCCKVVVEDCLCEENMNVGIHPGSGSFDCRVSRNVLRKNGYVGLFVCVAVTKTLFDENRIEHNQGCGISIGKEDTDNLFRGNRISNNAETGILFRRDDATLGAHRNVFERNVILDNLGPRPAKSNSRVSAAGCAAIVLEGVHDDLVFRGNRIGFTKPGSVGILKDPTIKRLLTNDNQLENVERLLADYEEK